MYQQTRERGERQQKKDLKRIISEPIGREGDKREKKENKRAGELGTKKKGQGKKGNETKYQRKETLEMYISNLSNVSP